jgi:hypothetical protein
MKSAKIENYDGRKWQGEPSLDPSEWIAEQIKLNSWGLPERTVEVDSEPYTEEDILESIPAVMDGDEQLEPPKVRLRAQYTIEIEDITAEVQAQAVAKRVLEAIQEGNKLIHEFATENVMLGITQDNMTAQVLDNMGPVLIALQTGSLYPAMDRIRAIPAESKDAKYITDARLLNYLNKIQQYLGLELSEEL